MDARCVMLCVGEQAGQDGERELKTEGEAGGSGLLQKASVRPETAETSL